MINRKNTAILVFSRFAKEEAKEKKFNKYLGKRSGVKLANSLITQTIKEVGLTKLPVYKFFPTEQRGDGFGEKLANSLETVFTYGFSNVIIIGSDCPSLSKEIILETDQKLQDNGLVLGPAKDGGVYLIGIKNTAYLRANFLSIPWLSSAVFNCLSRYASRLNITCAIQVAQEDIDHYSKILAWTKANCFNPIVALAVYLSGCFRRRMNSNVVIKTITRLQLNIEPLRGPPILPYNF